MPADLQTYPAVTQSAEAAGITSQCLCFVSIEDLMPSKKLYKIMKGFSSGQTQCGALQGWHFEDMLSEVKLMHEH